MVKRALALEAANEAVDKIRGKSGEGSSDRKRKYESGNAPKVQQTAKKAGKAPVGSSMVRVFRVNSKSLMSEEQAAVDRQLIAVDRPAFLNSGITGTVASCRQPFCCCRQIDTDQQKLSSVCCYLLTAPSWLSTATTLIRISTLFCLCVRHTHLEKGQSLFSGLEPPPEVAMARYAAILEDCDTRTRRDLITTGRLVPTCCRFNPAPSSAERGLTPHRDTMRRETLSRPDLIATRRYVAT
ncbi:hypothetical protein Taro_055107 [Colocasia esculenta]|uniref:Uncharacterized protein n=1 Tax=Colocasia esculenta TaxID=4460 RepID=A0A843XQL4_COLES|nr:hypothetical protein [Colocasia esculenta]